MADLRVRLYDLPEADHSAVEAQGVRIRRAIAPERRVVVAWVERHFFPPWAAECEVAFSALPISVWVAVRRDELLGFACADATAKGFFGPTGVLEAERGKRIGEALLFAALRGLREAGYAYAIIGGAGPVEFYRKRFDAMEIPGSDPGIYRGMLRARRNQGGNGS